MEKGRSGAGFHAEFAINMSQMVVHRAGAGAEVAIPLTPVQGDDKFFA